MYVCICNALNTRSVNDAIDDGAATVAQVYKALDAVPQCGKCKNTIRCMLGERTSPCITAGVATSMPADPLHPAQMRPSAEASPAA